MNKISFVSIRRAKETDFKELFNLIHLAFGNKTESNLVKRLISDGEVLINLLAETSDSILGNVIVSQSTMEPDLGLFCGGVAPLSVLPDHQSLGIGSKLMRETIKESKKMGMDALFLLGNPSYYKKFSFNVSNIRNEYGFGSFLELELTKGCLVNVKSKFSYANAFSSLE